MNLKRIAPALAALALIFSASAAAETSVVGWGENFHGELGAGYRSATQGPTTAKVPCSPKEVASGVAWNLVLCNNGEVYAYGSNQVGQLGQGKPSTGSSTPIPINSLKTKGVKQVAGSGSHAMALLSNGTVMVWGSNLFGELGNGTSTGGKERAGDNAPAPQFVPNLSNVCAIAAGGPTDLALLCNGTVLGWGGNDTHQIGPGYKEILVPTLIPGLSNVRSVAVGGFPFAGGHTLAILNDGTVKALGRNDQGQLGDGTTKTTAAPVEVKGLSGVAAVSADVSHSLALTTGGAAYSFGGNTYGQLGNGSTVSSTVPVLLGLQSVSAVSAGFRFSVAVSNGRAYDWGWNTKGELGDGTQTMRTSPIAVPELQGLTAISAGWYHTAAISQGPAPQPNLELVAGPGSLTAKWRAAPETKPWKVSWRAVTRPRSAWSPSPAISNKASSYTVSGLTPGVTYEVRVQNQHFGPEVLVGTPR